MARFRDFPSLWCGAPPTTTTTKNFHMLWVRANPRPLFFLRTPHICWAKWSQICSNSKHSREIALLRYFELFGHNSCISAMLWLRANLRPLRPTNMGGPQEKKWPQICSNSMHKKVLSVGGGGWGPTAEWRKIPETGHPSVSSILGWSAQRRVCIEI